MLIFDNQEPNMRIEQGKVQFTAETFTIQTFAAAVGVWPATVHYWCKTGKLDLDQPPYDVITQFYNIITECTRCGRRAKPGVGVERWCLHCGEPRLKIGITFYFDQDSGDDANSGVTPDQAFRTSSKAMCRARSPLDKRVNLRRR